MSTRVPPLTRPQAYATHLLQAYRKQLLGMQRPACAPRPKLLELIDKELARRAAAIPKHNDG